jgi:hypothetical protein
VREEPCPNAMKNATTPTHPVEPEPYPNETSEEAAQNPTQLPVEPDFGRELPPAEPEDPGVTKPKV